MSHQYMVSMTTICPVSQLWGRETRLHLAFGRL